jgi:hypothetical protein
MTILSHLQEGGDLSTFENHYGHTADSVNPVVTSAEFILKVSVNGTFSERQAHHKTVRMSVWFKSTMTA